MSRNPVGNFGDALKDISYYLTTGDISSDEADKLEEKIGIVLTVITNIGIILSIVMPACIGVKYMLGSVETKADYKKDMIPYLVGSVLLFGICTIVKVLQIIGKNINNI